VFGVAVLTVPPATTVVAIVLATTTLDACSGAAYQPNRKQDSEGCTHDCFQKSLVSQGQ
jgi:hypothetical protein